MSGLHQQDEIGQTNLWIITNKNEKAYFYKIFHQGYLLLAETSSLIVKDLTSPRVFTRKGFGVVEGGYAAFHHTISPFFRTQR